MEIPFLGQNLFRSGINIFAKATLLDPTAFWFSHGGSHIELIFKIKNKVILEYAAAFRKTNYG